MDLLKNLLKNPRVVAGVLAVLLTAVGVTGVTVTVDGGSDSSSPPPAPLGSGHGKAGPGSDVGSDLRSESGISSAARAKNAEIGRKVRRRSPERVAGVPCRVDYGGHVYSDRAAGVVPTLFVEHYTVSHNTPGWGDVYAIQHYFQTARLGSAHFIVDFEGHCLKMVPGEKKAWTQGNVNSYAYSVEVIAYGNEPASAWKTSALFKDRILARLTASVMRAHGLPLRRVDPVGCVFPAGVTDHDALECGNDHHDVSPHFPWRVFMRQLRAAGRSHEFPLAG